MPRQSRPSRQHLRLARPSGLKERLAAAFMLGVVLFNPPLLAVASLDETVMGVPVLYLWLFGGWALLIAVLAFMVEGRAGDEE